MTDSLIEKLQAASADIAEYGAPEYWVRMSDVKKIVRQHAKSDKPFHVLCAEPMTNFSRSQMNHEAALPQMVAQQRERLRNQAEERRDGHGDIVKRSDLEDECQSCRDREEDLQILRDVNRWQPIATAPKDGTPILCCLVYPDTGPPEIVAASWDTRNSAFPWRYITGGGCARNIPTHWMPLPTLPSEVA